MAIWQLTACDLVAHLKRREVSAAEAVGAALERIAAVEPAVNAIPTVCAERARAAARAIDEGRHAPPGDGPWLAGLPIAIKDLTAVKGVRTTQGSRVFADAVPARSDILVERLEARGAVVIGKSNTPEFGAGANTFNEVFGATRNPWNTALTCGGSSGGSAVALATGEVALAHGSDLGGSLRTPAAFCGVVGLRPSPGRVARGPTVLPFDELGVQGPMGRTVADAALLLDAMAGGHDADPFALPSPAVRFAAALERPARPLRVAISADFGVGPVEAPVRRAVLAAGAQLAAAGWPVEEATPDLTDAHEIFQVLRAQRFAATLAPLLERHRDLLKPEVVWNIEQGLALDGARIARAEAARGRLIQRVTAFFATFDLLLGPAAAVQPFPVERRYVEEIEGVRLATYIDWIAVTYAITLTGLPAIVLPCAMSAAGLPIGLQVVGRPRGEARLLGAAALAEGVFGLAGGIPIDPRGPAESG